jgi:hypothetical protein
MNAILQNILVVIAVVLALWFLLTKFGVLPKQASSKSKSCGKDDCGCH